MNIPLECFILATSFLRIGHYKSDGGAGVGIFGGVSKSVTQSTIAPE